MRDVLKLLIGATALLVFFLYIAMPTDQELFVVECNARYGEGHWEVLDAGYDEKPLLFAENIDHPLTCRSVRT